MKNAVIQRTGATEREYFLYTQRKERVISEEMRHKDEGLRDEGATVTPMQFVVWFHNKVKANQMSKSTVRYTRAAFRYSLGLLKTRDADIAISYLKNIKHLGEKKEPVGPSKKVKTISVSDNIKLRNALLNSGSKWGNFAAQWMKYTLMNGMRPCELKDLKLTLLENGDYASVITNAKATNGRAHGVYRHIPHPMLTESELEEFRIFLDQKSELIAEYGFENVYQSARGCIRHYAKKCFPKRKSVASLYTMRHQFNANMKASGLSKVAVAALDGHVNINTAARHYARAVSGVSQPGVYALLEEELRVTSGTNEWVGPSRTS